MKKFLVLALLTIFVFNFSDALIIKVPAYTTECIIERVDADTTLSGSYEVGAGGQMQINVKVYISYLLAFRLQMKVVMKFITNSKLQGIDLK